MLVTFLRVRAREAGTSAPRGDGSVPSADVELATSDYYDAGDRYDALCHHHL
jgi:hypothetical protein